jgi:antitoxin component HigA of HigAB toxin-antitoxin module
MTETVYRYMIGLDSLHDYLAELLDSPLTDEQRIGMLISYIQVEADDGFLSGTETPEGYNVIRSHLNDVSYYELALRLYGEALA